MKPITSRGLFTAKVVATLFLFSFSLAAQNSVPGVPDSEGVIGNTAPLVSITFVGLNHFTEAQATAVAGLHLQQIVGKDDFKAAADKLAQSGAFDKVAYKFSSGPAGVTLEYDVVEDSHLAACQFDNFIWFSDDEIKQAVSNAVPLFGDVIPINGPTINQIDAALTALLATKSLPSQVQHLSGANGLILFRATGANIQVTQFLFPGALPAHEAGLKAAAAEETRADYSLSATNAFAANTLTDYYRRLGYFRAQFGPAAGALNTNADNRLFDVTITISVREGAQYLWNGAHWNGNQALKSGDLDRLLGMKQKDVADGSKLDTGMQAISASYGSQGYIDASIQHQENIDDANLLVTYDVSITEGIQYRMGQVSFVGVPDAAAKKLASEWQLKPGSVFDNSYFFTQFAKKSSLTKVAGKTVNGKTIMNAIPTLKRNPQTATVDVTVTIR